MAINMGIDSNTPQENAKPDKGKHGLISLRVSLGDKEDRKETENQACARQCRKGLGQPG